MAALRIRIDGSGPVALAFALFVDRLLGPDVSILMPSVAAQSAHPAPAALAARPLAISHGTRLLLERVAAFPAEAAPIERIDIALSGLPGRMRLDAAELRQPALGWVVRHGRLLGALHDALSTLARPDDASDAADADVQVIADGDLGEDAELLLHGQSAVLAEVAADRGSAGPAVERFTPEGPLALLPLPAQPAMPARWALVWCADSELSEARAALPEARFEQALQQAFGEAFGALTLASERTVAPLARRARRVLVRERTVWIGNAAQALHPVAGQGLNLGVRDAFELADALARTAQRNEPPAVALARYARRRVADRASIMRITDALARGLQAPLVRPLQSLILAVLDALPPARGALARGFMHGFARL